MLTYSQAKSSIYKFKFVYVGIVINGLFFDDLGSCLDGLT
jgi:hypothetical protein